jgi:hypothetical protein
MILILGCVVPMMFVLRFLYAGFSEKPKRAWCAAQGYEVRYRNRQMFCYHRAADRFVAIPQISSDPPRH